MDQAILAAPRGHHVTVMLAESGTARLAFARTRQPLPDRTRIKKVINRSDDAVTDTVAGPPEAHGDDPRRRRALRRAREKGRACRDGRLGQWRHAGGTARYGGDRRLSLETCAFQTLQTDQRCCEMGLAVKPGASVDSQKPGLRRSAAHLMVKGTRPAEGRPRAGSKRIGR
ncbi:hypothetical protein [Paracoccus sp. Ld10]|uniref:hypothetical protein n=1 Tax=Paracoccus sp. Ld10 TaxID=649158 RepID=UPI00386DBBA3